MTAPSFALRLQAAWLHRGALAVSLLPLSALFHALSSGRRWLYRAGLRPVESLPVPVIVIGNIVAGGAGKTPTTLAVARLLRRHGFVPGVVSRGYGRTALDVALVRRESSAADVGDEPLLLHRLTGMPVAVGLDRVAAGHHLLEANPEVNVVLSDDGLQHFRLARDVEVIVFDERGTGNGWVLPAGPLREPLRPADRPQALVVYNAPQPSTPWPGVLAQRRLGSVWPLAAWHAGNPPEHAVQHLRGRPLLAVAGVARPERFFGMLRDEGLTFGVIPLDDHARFDTLPWPPDTPDVVVTEKDAVKLHADRCGNTRVWVVALDFALGADFEAALLRQLALARARTAPHS